jgi:hypothetical protein
MMMIIDDVEQMRENNKHTKHVHIIYKYKLPIIAFLYRISAKQAK